MGKAVFDEAGAKHHNITDAAPNGLKLGKVMRACHRAGGGVGGCSSGIL